MARSNDIYREAETLAKFSNLDPADTDQLSSTNVENFRNNYSDFFPSGFWDTPVITVPAGEVMGKILGPSESAWIPHQKLVRDAWQNKFGLENCVGQITSIGQLSQIEQTVARSSELMRKSPVIPAFELPEVKVWPCQRAVMFLGVESWRVRFCASCGNRYAAAHSRQQFCGDSCFQKSRKEAKRAWWGEHGQNWRAKKSSNKVVNRKKEKP